MTRTTTLTLSGLLIGFASVTTGCKKNKEVAKPKGEVEIVEYCTGGEYESDNKHFRSSATGESQDREIAKKKARSNGRNPLGQDGECDSESRDGQLRVEHGVQQPRGSHRNLQ